MDKLGVINLALLKCGLPLAATAADADYNASMIFDLTAEQDIRAHNWSFATKMASLAKAAASPSCGFDFAYLKPADCVRVIDVRQSPEIRAPRARMITQGNAVLTNASPCYARYLWLQMDPNEWPADFTDAVAAHIACQIAPLSAEKSSLTPQLFQLYQAQLAQAMANDAREETARVPLDESLFEARAGGAGR